MNANQQNNGSKAIIIILSLLLAALAFFAYQNYKKNQQSEEALLEEKLEIQTDLDLKIAELETAIAENTSISDELTVAKNSIVSFRDSVKSLKTLNYKILRRYKNKLAVLESSNNKLLQLSDSLKVANFGLSIEVDSAHANIKKQATRIIEQTYKNDSLSKENTDLTDKVEKGSALKISDVSALAMKERRSGELKETNYAKRTDAFRTSFIIRENVIAKSGSKKAFIVIQDASGKVIGGLESFTDISDTDILFSDTTDIKYSNKDMEVIVITNIPEKSISKGNYTIKVYLESKLLGITKVGLK